MIVLRTPKGWTGPKEVDGQPVEGTFRSHQVPLAATRTNAEHRAMLESWMRSYRPEELFDATGRLMPELQALAPNGDRRMSANRTPTVAGCSATSSMPDFRAYAVPVRSPATELSEATKVMGAFLRDIIVGQSATSSGSWARRDRFEPAAAGLRGRPTGPGTPRLLPGDDHLAPTVG
jgi:xylulose-5-phosphate/fructose-6-phosphate phosphoketolase